MHRAGPVALALALHDKYENGHSIRELSEESSYSIARGLALTV
ncbi:MAG: hypothetical protein OZ919_10505 [Xanthomonadaceae bacterium]|nr:hypothetical protein [Xanthomonadaceae bacterium]